MPDWTAITGIVVAGVVGPAVGALWGRSRQGRQFRHEVTMRDVAELRLLLDDAAESLERVDHARGAAYVRILQDVRPAEEGREVINRFRAQVAALSVLNATLDTAGGSRSTPINCSRMPSRPWCKCSMRSTWRRSRASAPTW